MMQCYSFCCFFAARFSHTKLQLFDLRFEAYPKQVAFPGVLVFFSPRSLQVHDFPIGGLFLL